jgi:hypothetical protein
MTGVERTLSYHTTSRRSPFPSDPAQSTPSDENVGEEEHSELTTVRLKIPAGVWDGYAFVIPGKGHAGRAGEEVGDLVVEVLVEEHESFYREVGRPERRGGEGKRQ